MAAGSVERTGVCASVWRELAGEARPPDRTHPTGTSKAQGWRIGRGAGICGGVPRRDPDDPPRASVGRPSFSWPGKAEAEALARTPGAARMSEAPDESLAHATTENLFVEGDNLEALKLLQATHAGQVKLIYIDPPYNTGNDYTYPDRYADHAAWLSMMLPRLVLARALLRADGALCVSIDDREAHHLRVLLDELFGEANHAATIAWQKRDTPANDARGISVTHEYVLVYRRSEAFARNLLPRSDDQLANYKNPDGDPRGPWTRTSLIRKEERAGRRYAVKNPQGRERVPPAGTSWRVPPETFAAYAAEGRIWWGQDGDSDLPYLKRFVTDVREGVVPVTWWSHEFAGSNRHAKLEIRELFAGEVPFDTPKPVKLLRRIVALASGEGDVVLDFFAGSCTTAQAVLEQNRADGGRRRFIVVQEAAPTGRADLPTIAEVGKERIRRACARLGARPGEDVGFRVVKLVAREAE